MGDSLEQYRGRIGKYALRIPSLESFSGASSRSKKAFLGLSREKERVYKEIREENLNFFSGFLTLCVTFCVLLMFKVDTGTGALNSTSFANPQFNLPAESIKGWSTFNIVLPFLPHKLQCLVILKLTQVLEIQGQ